MRCMSRAAAALIGLLVAYAALPLCSTAFTCTMPCCEHSAEPMEEHGTMPAPVCGGMPSDCAVAAVVPADTGAVLLLQGQMLLASPIAEPRAFSDIARPASYAPLVQPRSNTLRLYVLNDVFLI